MGRDKPEKLGREKKEGRESEGTKHIRPLQNDHCFQLESKSSPLQNAGKRQAFLLSCNCFLKK